MGYFKSFALETNHEVLILKHYDDENDCFICKIFIEDSSIIHEAAVSFNSEQERNDMFNKYTIEDAVSFADFFIN